MIHVAFILFDKWVYHPYWGKGYQLWSGVAGSFVTSSGIYAGIFLWWRKHNCHVTGCWRLQWHPHPDNGHPVCKKHHPHELHV